MSSLRITVPDDVAAVLDSVPDAAQYIAESVRLRVAAGAAGDFRLFLAGQGIHITDEGVRAARERLAAAEARRDASRGRRRVGPVGVRSGAVRAEAPAQPEQEPV